MNNEGVVFSIQRNGEAILLEWQDGFEQLYRSLPIGVYSSWRSFNKRLFLGLDAHLARTERSIELLGWDFDWDEQLIRSGIDQACRLAPYDEAQLRLDILREAVPGLESRILLTLRPLKKVPKAFYEEGVGVTVAVGLKRERPLVKDAAFVQARASYEVGTQEKYEILLQSEDGRLLEGGSSNIYFLLDGALYVGGEELLQGVTRKIMLQLVEQLTISIRYESLFLDQLGGVSEAFLTSSSRGIVPLVRVDETIIGDGKVGAMTHQLMRAYTAYLEEQLQLAI